ncbi:Ser/Thr protein phosphatase [Tritrichomonas foetus]|uniref:Serine/threonine-protein phosphatase n=1 Tax=Tritrichomonas foetus TaxID=1144522 RepID=A0A1J4JCT2_9EUKA|nr:Ser/Thr protein phosphatase [Tritrichomonas foetus]|eukprot:OHS96071.1 Ser/Thr protein phosphatase [Tritrichomonas foetus]
MTASNLDLKKTLEDIGRGDTIDEQIVVAILMKLMELLYKERNVLLLQSPIIICGDIHGQLDDLLQLFEEAGDKFTDQFLFMGDYVDRGYHSLNTFLYLVVLKLINPSKFHMLRGNHETRQVSQMYGFYNECILNYGHAGIWNLCNAAFDLLPMAALIDHDVFSVHGGLSPDLPLIEMISLYDRQDELPSSGPLCDLCWSDPEDVKKWRQNQRGAGYFFGENEVTRFNLLNNISLVTRSHQLVLEGSKFYFPARENEPKKSGSCDEGRLVTIWSAPNYSYRSNNKASIMKYKFDGCPTYNIITFNANEVRIKPQHMPVTSHYFA